MPLSGGEGDKSGQFPLVQQAFPDFSLHDEATAVNFWKTTSLGAYFGVGLGGTTTGRAANLLIIDDPIKARTEAESASYRNNTWSYYVSALLTRKQPEPSGLPPIEIFIMTRWHPDDPIGRIMESDDWRDGDWHHLDFPAINDKEESLWPERFPIETLRKIERRDPREFASLYQQRPFVAGGNILKTSHLRTYTPDNLPPAFASTIITADTAFKKTQTADYTAIIVAAVDHSGLIYILDLIRRRLDYTELRSILQTLYASYRTRGLSAIHIEDKASGQSILQELRQLHLPVVAYQNHNDKVARAKLISPLIDSGVISIPQSSQWLDTFIQELQSFPASKHDDQVDAFTMAVDILSKTAVNTNEALTSTLPKFLSTTNRTISTSFPPLIPKERTSFKHLLSWGD